MLKLPFLAALLVFSISQKVVQMDSSARKWRDPGDPAPDNSAVASRIATVRRLFLPAATSRYSYRAFSGTASSRSPYNGGTRYLSQRVSCTLAADHCLCLRYVHVYCQTATAKGKTSSTIPDTLACLYVVLRRPQRHLAFAPEKALDRREAGLGGRLASFARRISLLLSCAVGWRPSSDEGLL